MKKILRIISALFAIVLLGSSAILVSFAHSGGTDGQGGHYDNTTGEYHYHHGHPAHQHYDIDGDGTIDCPYNFEDDTNNNTNSTSGTGSTYPEVPFNFTIEEHPLDPEEKSASVKDNKNVELPVEKEVSNMPNYIYWIISLLIVIAIIMFFVIRSRNKEISDLEHDICKTREQQRKAEENASAKEQAYIKENSNLKSQVASLTDKLNKSNADLLNEKLKSKNLKGVPNGIIFADDGLPIYWKERPDKPYGDFTVYYSKKSNIYHVDRFCASYTASIEHIFNVIGSGNPCKKCAVGFFNFKSIPDWYKRSKDTLS